MRRLDPSEFFAVTIPVLAEFVAVAFAIGVFVLLLGVAGDHAPITCNAGSVLALFTDCEVQ